MQVNEAGVVSASVVGEAIAIFLCIWQDLDARYGGHAAIISDISLSFLVMLKCLKQEAIHCSSRESCSI